MRFSLLPVALCSAIAAAHAQSAPRPLSLVQEERVELSKAGGAREALVEPGPGGKVALAPRMGWNGDIHVFDSTGAALPWKVRTGRNDSSEIMVVNRMGWISGTNTLWVSDRGYNQVALIDAAGKVTKSIEYASWVHPTWANRRNYPVFGAMDPLAVYSDETMLIMPGRERSFISTPGYDHSVLHILRTTWNGSIQRTVATLPPGDGGIEVRSPNGLGHVMTVPFAAHTMWSVSPNGLRIAIAAPGVSVADSGTIRVVALNDRGDTIFARRYPCEAVRVSKDAVDRFLGTIGAVGALSAERLRDSAAKQIPAFMSPLTGVIAGADGTTWVLLRPLAADTSKDTRALVLDPKGDVVGTAVIPPAQTPAAVSASHLWVIEMGRMKTPSAVVRYAVRATGAPPPRTAKPSASPSPSRAPR